MLLIFEIVMLVGGLYAIITAQIPSFMLGGGKYQVEGMGARLIGFLWMMPLTIAFIGGYVFGLLYGESGLGYAVTLEFLAIFGVVILSVVLVRIIGKENEPSTSVEATIIKKSQGALMYAIFSATGLASLVCCPLAFVYSGQAMNLIDEHGVGRQYRKKAKMARAIAGIATLVWGSIVFCFASFIFANI